ncbi:MAG TPA: phage holin family protein [Jatrophihabitans sp.]|nr:phage holin family protein [Jatrophihabitans sp.]
MSDPRSLQDSTNPSTGELIARMSADLSTLVRDEIRLAQLEVTGKAKKAGLGVGLFGSAGMLAWFGVAALVAAAILGLATAVAAWLAAVIIGAALFVLAGILALAGKKEVGQASPPVPTEAISGVQADVQTVKAAAHR